jgi:hypothetical protein
MLLNEPTAALRVVSVRLLATGGAGLSPAHSWAPGEILVRRPGPAGGGGGALGGGSPAWRCNLPKLTLRRETLRALTSLDLTRAAGGDATLPRETNGAVCTNQAAPKPAGG